MRIALISLGIVLISAWNSHTVAGPSWSPAVPASEEVIEGIDYRSAVGDHPTSVAMARAIDARLIVRESRQGEPIHVQHCRVTEGGCRARIATLSRLITEASNRAGVDPFLTAAIDRHGDNATLNCLLGRAHTAAGNVGLAQECYTAALQTEPDNQLAKKLLQETEAGLFLDAD